MLARCWSLSRLSLNNSWLTPRTSRSSITGPHTQTHTTILTHTPSYRQFSAANSASQVRLWTVGGSRSGHRTHAGTGRTEQVHIRRPKGLDFNTCNLLSVRQQNQPNRQQVLFREIIFVLFFLLVYLRYWWLHLQTTLTSTLIRTMFKSHLILEEFYGGMEIWDDSSTMEYLNILTSTTMQGTEFESWSSESNRMQIFQCLHQFIVPLSQLENTVCLLTIMAAVNGRCSGNRCSGAEMSITWRLFCDGWLILATSCIYHAI